MIEAFVTFSLIGLGLGAWAAAGPARRFYRQRQGRGAPGDGASFWATLFSDDRRGGDTSGGGLH